MLIDHGVSVNAVSNVGWSALHYSCLRGHFRLVKLLLENDIDVNIENNMSNTAAYFAFKSGNVEIVNILLEYGLQVSSKDLADILWLIKFWTAFVQGTHFAKYEQFISCVCELFKYKTMIDDNCELSLVIVETVYRTYIRQKFELISDKSLRKVVKHLLKLSVYIGHIDQMKLRKSSWFNTYFNLDKHKNIVANQHDNDNQNNKTSQINENEDTLNYKYFQNTDNNDENAFLIYKEFRQLLINLAYKPPSLMSLCRRSIRKQMHNFNRKSLNQLPIPLKLHQYLHFDYF